MKPNVLIMSGYGINCEKESAHAFELAGAKCDIVHINDLISKKKFLSDYDIIMFPGGFSYGDDTGSGNAFANKIRNNLWEDLVKFIDAKKLILGVCNGFQIMTHLGLFSLPDTTHGERIHSMEANSSNKYICKWVDLKTEKNDCLWTKDINATHIPIAHGEGRFDCSEAILQKLKSNNQIVFRYYKNPNGSKFDVAGICDKSGRIMGMMPHPERGLYSISEPDFHLKQELAKRQGLEVPEIVESNLKIFQNAVDYFEEELLGSAATMNRTEEDFLDSFGNKVSGIFSVPKDASLVVILSHGFTSNKNSKNYRELEKKLNDLGIGTLRYDYYGHGPNYVRGPGYAVLRDVTLSKMRESLKASIKFVRKKGDYDIVLLGSSFGGLVSMICASEDNEIKGLVLKSTVAEPLSFWKGRLSEEEFEKWKEEGVLHYDSPLEKYDLDYGYWLDLQSYDSLKLAKSISCKTLIIHGDDDQIVPIGQSRELARAIGTEVKIVEDAGHFYELAEQHEEMINNIIEFLVSMRTKVDLSDKGMSYKDSGVNIEAGDEASKVLYNAAKKTWENREGNIGELIVPFDDFSGIRGIDVSNLPEGSFMSMGFDGVGTKVEIAQRMENHKTIAFDLLAMVCDDAIVRGAEPVLVGSVLDVNSLREGQSIKSLKELAEGYVKAAEDANVAIINGEMAELGNSIGGYGDFKYNWSSALIWFANKEKLFTGKEINVGDYIVAFKEDGFRANGLSLVRKILETKYGTEWHNLELDNEKLGNLVLAPSKIYSRAVVNMHGGFKTEGTCKINGVSHITGGGIPGKLSRVLKPSGFGAVLDNLFEPCKIMKHCQKLGKVSDDESYRTWNMGQGLLVITPDPVKVIDEASKFGIDAQVCGKVVEERGIRIISRGMDAGKELVF